LNNQTSKSFKPNQTSSYNQAFKMAATMDKVKNVLHLNKDHSTTGTHSTNGHTTASGTSEGVAGPHNSRIANSADPRVDSDMDGSRTAGTAGTTGTGYTSTGTGPSGSTNAGPRNTEAVGGTGTEVGNNAGTNTGFSGGMSNSANAGPHDSNLANKADPRVDSDLDGRGNRHGATTGGVFGANGSHATPGSGTAQNTAGPHNSDMMNKLDPRVDSDRDGSKTFGGNKTHA